MPCNYPQTGIEKIAKMVVAGAECKVVAGFQSPPNAWLLQFALEHVVLYYTPCYYPQTGIMKIAKMAVAGAGCKAAVSSQSLAIEWMLRP